MNPLTKDLFQVLAWAAAVLGGLVAAYKVLAERRRDREQRQEDMRWKRAEMAKKCLDEIFENSLARAAMKMLDWDGLQFDRPDGNKTHPIDTTIRRRALRTANTVFDPADDDQFVRDAFDALFDGFERLEQFIRIRLILIEDVEMPLRYYVKRMARPNDRAVFSTFLDAYEFDFARHFLRRFDDWCVGELE